MEYRKISLMVKALREDRREIKEPFKRALSRLGEVFQTLRNTSAGLESKYVFPRVLFVVSYIIFKFLHYAHLSA